MSPGNGPGRASLPTPSWLGAACGKHGLGAGGVLSAAAGALGQFLLKLEVYLQDAFSWPPQCTRLILRVPEYSKFPGDVPSNFFTSLPLGANQQFRFLSPCHPTHLRQRWANVG